MWWKIFQVRLETLLFMETIVHKLQRDSGYGFIDVDMPMVDTEVVSGDLGCLR